MLHEAVRPVSTGGAVFLLLLLVSAAAGASEELFVDDHGFAVQSLSTDRLQERTCSQHTNVPSTLRRKTPEERQPESNERRRLCVDPDVSGIDRCELDAVWEQPFEHASWLSPAAGHQGKRAPRLSAICADLVGCREDSWCASVREPDASTRAPERPNCLKRGRHDLVDLHRWCRYERHPSLRRESHPPTRPIERCTR